MTSFESTDRFFRPSDLKTTRRNYRQLQAKRILIFLANAMLIFSLVLGGFWLFRRTQEDRRFSITRIETTGVRHTSPVALDALTRRYHGLNLFRLNIETLRRDMAELPWVERVAIEKQLPNTLRLQVFERQPVALALDAGKLRYVDRQGVIFADLSPQFGDAELPLVTQSSGTEVLRTVRFLQDVKQLHPELYSRISEISPIVPAGYIVFDRDLSTRIYVGERGYAEKWIALYQIAAAQPYEEGGIEYADLRFDRRVVVKARNALSRGQTDYRPLAGGITN